jgi:hypothetical protein
MGLVAHEVDALISAQAGKPLAEALTDAASLIAQHPVRAGLARVEPSALARLGRMDVDAPGWAAAHDAVGAALTAAGRGGTDTVVRWIASFLLSPAPRAAIAADVVVLLAGLPVLADIEVDRPA